jgi:sporulation protein YlmC with PRC-barrel domain
MNADPCSWFLIEKGWSVVDSDGTEIGKVHEIVGDENEDIFDGLAISSGRLSKPHYVPAERVKGIVQGQVRLDLDASEALRLEPYAEPPVQERILPEGRSWWDRLRGR